MINKQVIIIRPKILKGLKDPRGLYDIIESYIHSQKKIHFEFQ